MHTLISINHRSRSVRELSEALIRTPNKGGGRTLI